MCDPLVVKSGKVQPASLALQSGGTSGFNLYNGGITCAIGTEKADAGSDAVIMAAMITATLEYTGSRGGSAPQGYAGGPWGSAPWAPSYID